MCEKQDCDFLDLTLWVNAIGDRWAILLTCPMLSDQLCEFGGVWEISVMNRVQRTYLLRDYGWILGGR